MLLKGMMVMAMLTSTTVVAEEKRWKVKPDFENKSAAMQISGTSCPDLSKRQDWCIAVNDEKKYIQFFQRDGRTITPGKLARIMEKKTAAGQKQAEPDIEAVARDGGYVYLTGSHGAPRNGGPVQPSRFHVFRLRVDAATGKPRFKITRKKVAKGIISSMRLGPAIAALPELAAFAGKPLSQNGVTIEGMGARDGQLYFALRTPVDQGGAFILEASANALFSNKKVKLIPHRIDLGDGYGIRAIERYRDAFLLLAGTGFGAEMLPVVWIWAPGHAAHQVAVLDVPEGWKAESLMLLSDKPGKRPRVLVFFDGQKNGAPLEFKLPIR